MADLNIYREKVSVSGRNSDYSVATGAGLLGDFSLFDELMNRPDLTVLVTDTTVAGHYLKPVKEALERIGHNVKQIILPVGEEHKSLETASLIFDRLVSSSATRSDMIVGLGGGVICDIAGFVASTFKRGMRLIQLPTTVLAQVDASVGGKTAVNHEKGKNLIGSFFQPELVLADTGTLLTLTDREFLNGIAEVIKYGVICDEELFRLLAKERDRILERDQPLLAGIVNRCVRLKADIVEQDEKETEGIREILNFGHTYGHAAEIITGFSLKHGEAVAVGMVLEAKLAVDERSLSRDQLDAIKDLIASYGLPVELNTGFDRSVLSDLFRQDKKVRYGRIRIPLPEAIGKTTVRELKCSKLL